VGGLIGAFLGEWLGARTAVLIGALGCCLAFLPVFLSPLRAMRTLPTLSPVEAVRPGLDRPIP
jgi:hypothetical protein